MLLTWVMNMLLAVDLAHVTLLTWHWRYYSAHVPLIHSAPHGPFFVTPCTIECLPSLLTLLAWNAWKRGCIYVCVKRRLRPMLIDAKLPTMLRPPA